MKTQYAYFFILLYATALIRPIIPVIEYSINFDYISKVLCINKDEPELECAGKCQLAKEIKKTMPTETGDKKPVLPSTEFDKFPITYHNTIQQICFIFAPLKTLNCFGNHVGKTINYISSVFHPPDVLV